MNLTEIIKDAFIFPSQNLETLAIFSILSILSGAFAFEGIITFIFGIIDFTNFIFGGIYITIAIIIGFIITRISMQCIKSGINLEEKLPDFKWWGSLSIGFKKVVITIYYYLIPILIVIFVGIITDIFGSVLNIVQTITIQIPLAFTRDPAVVDAISHSSLPLFASLAIIVTVAFIILLIFSFFQHMAEARLANTGNLKEALNIIGAARDITRIGVGKLIILSVLIFVIVICVESVLTLIFDQLIILSILNIVITPYLTLFAQRALGLLYSDIV